MMLGSLHKRQVFCLISHICRGERRFEEPAGEPGGALGSTNPATLVGTWTLTSKAHPTLVSKWLCRDVQRGLKGFAGQIKTRRKAAELIMNVNVLNCTLNMKSSIWCRTDAHENTDPRSNRPFAPQSAVSPHVVSHFELTWRREIRAPSSPVESTISHGRRMLAPARCVSRPGLKGKRVITKSMIN